MFSGGSLFNIEFYTLCPVTSTCFHQQQSIKSFSILSCILYEVLGVKDSKVYILFTGSVSLTSILVPFLKIICYYKGISFSEDAPAKWISLQRLFPENKHSLLLPLVKVLKSRLSTPFASQTYAPVLACVNSCTHTHVHLSGLWCWVIGWGATEAEWVWAITSCVCIIDGRSDVQRSSLPHLSAQSLL